MLGYWGARPADIQKGLEIHTKLLGGGLIFGTITLPHHRDHRLKKTGELIAEAMTYIINQCEYKAWKKTFGLLDNIQAMEVTYGDENGWHPHKHIMCFTERPLTEDAVAAAESLIHALYNRYLAEKDWKASQDPVGVRLDYVKNTADGVAITQYVTKLQASFEMARGDLKQSKSTHPATRGFGSERGRA